MVIPSVAQWFDFNHIHEIEMNSLPEFFCDLFPHKTPEAYLTMRNFIIKTYRQNPAAYLSATECRKKLPGDICSIIRLHAFLEHWGIINFSVEHNLRPAKIVLNDSGNVHQAVIDAAAKGFISLAEAKAIQSVLDHKSRDHDHEESSIPPNSHNVSAYMLLIAAKKIKAISSTYRPICNFCGCSCDQSWYKKVKAPETLGSDKNSELPKLEEEKSIHEVLKEITMTYILCESCFR